MPKASKGAGSTGRAGAGRRGGTRAFRAFGRELVARGLARRAGAGAGAGAGANPGATRRGGKRAGAGRPDANTSRLRAFIKRIGNLGRG